MDNTLLRIVTTFDGSKAIKGNCRSIKGEYYEQNRQCFMMPDGRWHRINNGKITFDYRSKSWKFFRDPTLVEGIIDGDKEEIKFGNFTYNNEDPILKIGGRTIPLLDRDLIKKLDLVEDIGYGYYYRRKDIDVPPSKNYVGTKRTYSYSTKLDYNSKHQLEYHIINHNKYNIDKKLNFFDDELEDTTFGIEFEVWNGTIPEVQLSKLGLIPLLDGSLRHDGVVSYEYATIPLRGGNGLYKIKKACDALTKYTEISKMCSLHVHIGGYEISKEMLVSLYTTVKMVEKDLYSMFPRYYKNTANFKQKNYCGPLPNVATKDRTLDQVFNNIYKWMSCGRDFIEFSHAEHPDDPTGNHKWNVPSRYSIVNFIPFLWGSTRTVEFRVHPPTVNAIKTINWVFICNAIMKFANLNKNNWQNIEKISLQELINSVYDIKLSNYLSEYINTLKEKRIIYDSVSDFTGDIWCKADESFTFSKAFMLTKHFDYADSY